MDKNTYHIDPAAGDDANDGLSPARPIRHHADRDIHPGDTVLFKRGSVVRGPLRTCDGAEGAPITYGAYGDGGKPMFLGSIPIGDPNLWIQERPSIWRYRDALPSEVCNLVFNNGEACGILRWQPEDLLQPGDWHYTTIGMSSGSESQGAADPRADILYLFSPVNPGQAWHEIECVLSPAEDPIDGLRLKEVPHSAGWQFGGVTVPAAIAGEPLLAEAYRAAAEQNVLRALNPNVFFGYFSVCADGKGHGNNTTFPGLDWGQSAEALLWLGRKAEVLASWEYVKGFQREDGLVPFAIIPDSAGTTSMVNGRYPLVVDERGAVFEHWVPGNPLRTLANVTFLVLADAIWTQTGDQTWLQAQAPHLRKAAEWLLTQITPDGLMCGGGFYVERPTRLEFDGINQCYSAHALMQAADMLDRVGEAAAAGRCRAAAKTLTAAFRTRFWAGDHCVEYIHPEHGSISRHGLTDVDWAAIATGTAGEEQIAILWPQLKVNPEFIYSGIPGGIATKPETYEDWEMHSIDRHDLAAMGRIWYVECWARACMGDREGILRSLRQVAAVGKANNWSWMERYYSEKTGDLGQYHFQYYCEYPANLIRIVHRFLEQRLDAFDKEDLK